MEGSSPELEEIKKGLVVSYDVLTTTLHINYLFDYSKKLIKSKLFDPQIMNWQIENSLLLKQMGLNFSFIKKKMEEKNKGYYKYDTLLSQISYRLEKHGQLAPLKEISKKLTEEDLKPDPELHKSINDINYYNLNDSFIDDEEAYKGEEDDGFFKLNLAYGNYTEEEIIRNLNRSKSFKRKHLSKIKGTNDQKNGKKIENEPMNQLLSTGHPLTTESELKPKMKKRKFGEGINLISLTTPKKEQLDTNNNNQNDNSNEDNNQKDISEEEHLKITFNALMKEYCELGFGIPLIEKEKEMFIKKIISAIKVLEQKWITQPSSYEKFLNIFSSQLNLEQKDFKIIFEYERFKSKIDGIYSNYAKLINQFVTFLVDGNIRDIRDLNEAIQSNQEVKEKADAISIKVFSYIKVYNDYFASVSLNASSEEEYYKTLELFIPKGNERNEEYLGKLSSKIKELFEKYKVDYSMKEFVDYFKQSFDQEIDAGPIEGKKVFLIDAFFFSELNAKHQKEEDKQLQQQQLTTQDPQGNLLSLALVQQGKKKKQIKGSAFSQMKVQQEPKQDENKSREIKVPVIQVVLAQSPPQHLARVPIGINESPQLDNSKEKRLIPNTITHYKKQHTPLISSNYYTCQYSEDHFVSHHNSLIKTNK